MSRKKKKNLSHMILERANENRSNQKYIAEDFIGATTIGKQFKKYQPSFIAALDSATKRNLSKISDETKEKLGSLIPITLAFEELEDGDFKIIFNFAENPITSKASVLSLRILVEGDSLKIVIEGTDAELYSASELSQLITSYNGLLVGLNNFGEFIDKIINFVSDLVYIYINYLDNFGVNEVDSEAIYKQEMIKSFLDYLTEELGREIFGNLVYNEFVDIDVDYNKYTISATAYSSDKLNYIIFDYIYSPETEKFVLTNIVSSKSTEVSKIKELTTDNLLEFITAIKADYAKLYEGISREEIVEMKKTKVKEEKAVVKESNILINLKSVNPETGEILIELNGSVYIYAIKSSIEKNIEDVEKEITGILSKSPENLMEYIANNLDIQANPIIENDGILTEDADTPDMPIKDDEASLDSGVSEEPEGKTPENFKPEGDPEKAPPEVPADPEIKDIVKDMDASHPEEPKAENKIEKAENKIENA